MPPTTCSATSEDMRICAALAVSTGTMPIFALGGVTITITGEDDWATAHMKMQWRNMSTQVATGGEVPPFFMRILLPSARRVSVRRHDSRVSTQLLFNAETDGLWPWGPKSITDCKGRVVATFTTSHFESDTNKNRIKYRYYINDPAGTQVAMSTVCRPAPSAPPRPAPPHPWQSSEPPRGVDAVACSQWAQRTRRSHSSTRRR